MRDAVAVVQWRRRQAATLRRGENGDNGPKCDNVLSTMLFCRCSVCGPRHVAESRRRTGVAAGDGDVR